MKNGDIVINEFEHVLGSIGNTEWWTDKDWEKWREYLHELSLSGDLGKTVRIRYELIYNEELDKPIDWKNKNSESIKFLIFDINSGI